MKTAIPMQDDRIASHFTKADHFIFLDEKGTIQTTKANPALDSDCAGKSALHKLLVAEHTERIIVRNIGQRSLAKLLQAGMQVWQANNGHFDSNILINKNKLTALTDPEQGRESLAHSAKKGNSGCHSQASKQNHGKCCQGKHKHGLKSATNNGCHCH